MSNNPYRSLPSVEALLWRLQAKGIERNPMLVRAARQAVDDAREAVRRGDSAPDASTLEDTAIALYEQLSRPSLRRVINASGVLLQTNLGRAPLSDAAMAAMAAVGAGYSNLEFDLEVGERGSRHNHVRNLLAQVTGAEDGIAVNNNAAALFMVLQVFAQGRDVIVSRGQAVEIGGGFRIPDVLRQSGANLVEVGTTNRTYARDYEDVMSWDTAAILRVHTSNFQVVGFVTSPTLQELATVAHADGALLIDDLGSGCLVNTEEYGLAHEPTVQESIAGGADLALFSGDKLLGGPQAGLIVGRTELIAKLRSHPLARALRVDKTTIAALNATLLAYANGTQSREIPIWRMLCTDPASLRERAANWATAAGGDSDVVESRTMVGGGSLPGQGVPTWCARIRASLSVDELAASLRAGDPPIVARVEDGAVLLDPRTVESADDAVVAEAIRGAVRRNT